MTGVFNPIDLHFLACGRRGHRLIMHISCRSAQTGCSPNRYADNSKRNRFVKILVLVMVNKNQLIKSLAFLSGFKLLSFFVPHH